MCGSEDQPGSQDKGHRRHHHGASPAAARGLGRCLGQLVNLSLEYRYLAHEVTQTVVLRLRFRVRVWLLGAHLRDKDRSGGRSINEVHFGFLREDCFESLASEADVA